MDLLLSNVINLSNLMSLCSKFILKASLKGPFSWDKRLCYTYFMTTKQIILFSFKSSPVR